MKSASAELPGTDRLLRAVADEQRRAVLRTLDAADDTLDYETLTERVVDRIRTGDEDLPRTEHRGQVRIALYHTHLPKLAESGLVVTDSDRKLVRSATDDEIRALLDCVESLE